MLRRFIKSIVPSRGDIFYTLFESAAIIANDSAKIFVDVLNSHDEATLNQLFAKSKLLKQKSEENNKNILKALNKMFITPIDRGDIQELSALFNKMTKRIVKLSTKLKIYNIDAHTDDCLIKNANTLVAITQTLVECVTALKTSNEDGIVKSGDRINELEENGIEDFRFAMNEMYSDKFDTLTILKLKEIYKSIDGAIELGVNIADLIMQVSLKSI